MPRFFLDITEGDQHFPDDIGEYFTDVKRAEREAAQVAASLARDEMAKDDVSAYAVTISVRNDRGERISTARASVKVERLMPSPGDPAPDGS